MGFYLLMEVDERLIISLMLYVDCMVFVNRDDKVGICRLYNFYI